MIKLKHLINESLESILKQMFSALKKSKNFNSIKMGNPFDRDEWNGDVILIKSKLKGIGKHRDEYDEYEIGIDSDVSSQNYGIVVQHTPSGHVTFVKTIKDVIMITRADDTSLNERNVPKMVNI